MFAQALESQSVGSLRRARILWKSTQHTKRKLKVVSRPQESDRWFFALLTTFSALLLYSFACGGKIRGDWTPLELFLAGVRGWKACLRN
jgi:hypothetical protein